jgi:N-acetylneuraminic acid mutarotase
MIKKRSVGLLFFPAVLLSLVLGLAFSPTPTSAQSPISCMFSPAYWQIKAPLPIGAYSVAVASDGNYLYAAGGNNGGPTNNFYLYNPQSDSWSALPALPQAVSEAMGIFADGKIYVIGGNSISGPSNIFQVYTIASGTWSSPTALPGVRQQVGGGYYAGKIYVVGGYTTGSVESAQNQTWEYTIATNSWATLADLPISLGGPGSAILNGYLYIMGGRNITIGVLTNAYSYNISGNSWSVIASLPTAVNYPGSVAFLERIWLFGGGNPFREGVEETSEEERSVSLTQVYDPATNTWASGPAQNVARSFQAGAVVQDSIISVGGWAGIYANTVEVLTREKFKILIIASDAGVVPNRMRMGLLAYPDVGQVDVFDGRYDTPTLEQLQNYHIVIPFSNSNWSDPVLLGDNLADYVDGGGIVVGFVFDFASGYTINGRWSAGGYSPFNNGSTLFVNATLGSAADHPIMAGVTSLSAFYRLKVSLASGATQVATWSDGWPLAAYKGRAVGVNAYIGDHSNNWSGDFARIVVNTGNWMWMGNRGCNGLVCPCATTINGAITSEDAIQTGRVLRDDPGSTCASPQSCSISSAGSIHYDAYRFVNNDINQQCVMVTLDATGCGGVYIQGVVYQDNFTPGAVCTNYLGDIGGSSLAAKSFAVVVPAWRDFVVVVNEVGASTYCPAYTLTISADNCLGVNRTYLPLIFRME